MKDCTAVCLEAAEAILVNLLTEKSSEFVGIIDSKHVFHLQQIINFTMMAGGF